MRPLALLAALGLCLSAATAAAQTADASAHAKSTPARLAAQPEPAAFTLRSDVTLTSEIVTFGDLIPGLSPAQAALPAFRAPALGQTGTIQVARILEAARMNDLPAFQTGPVGQVVVTRAARRITSGEIEFAVKQAIAERHGVDTRALALIFDSAAPSLAVEPEFDLPVNVLDMSYDQRVRRVSAVLAMPGSAATRLKPLRITGQLVETAEIVVPTRAITRGETIASADVALERRPRDGLSNDSLSDLQGAIGKVARQPILPGQALRTADLQRQEVVGRGDIVSMVFEAPGLVVSMRGKAGEAGGVGDVISVVNMQSKKTIQATIVAPGKVSVNPVSAGRVALAQ